MTTNAGLQRGTIRKLAEHTATLIYDMLPKALVALTKRCILDMLGITLAASCLSPKGKVLADYVREGGGRAESTVFEFDFKAPTGEAVFVNGTAEYPTLAKFINLNRV